MSELRPGWCLNCGEGQVDAVGHCARCGANAVLAQTLESIDPVHTGSERESRRIRLPESEASRRWIQATQRYASTLNQLAEDARGRLRTLQREANAFADAAAAIEGLRERLGTSSKPSTESQKVVIRKLSSIGPERWSAAFDACKDCGRSDTPHVAHGRCRSCDSKWRASGKPA